MSPEKVAKVVLTEVRGRVLLITMNRPESMNAITSGLGYGLLAAAEQLDRDPEILVGVLTGAGRGFCAGMDLNVFEREGPPEGIAEFLERGARKPLIAAIEGFAIAGGLEIALGCDLLVASRGAQLGIPEVNVGLFAGGGGLLRLPRRVPFSLASEMALTGDPISAERAYADGLLARLVDPGDAVDQSMALADRIACNSPAGVLLSKRMLKEMRGRSEAAFWHYQRPFLQDALEADDAREGARAFAEKRDPEWNYDYTLGR